MKIHIIGCSGSGKTYLAKALSNKYNIPHFDLDDVQWDNRADSYGVKNLPQKRNELLQEILANEQWIIEGVYYKWVGLSFEEAHTIYVLDMPKYLYKSRIIIRFLKRKLGLEKGKKETIQSVRALLKWTDTFQDKNMSEIRKILETYQEKVIWIKSKKEIKDFIRMDI